MAEPYYYEDEWVTLYLGDCRDLLVWLGADVLITDPPYGRQWRQGALKRSGSDAPGGIANDGDSDVRDDALGLWGDRPALVFGDLMLSPPPRTKQVLVYRKPPNAGTRGAMGGWRRDAEAIYVLGLWSTGLGGRSSVVATSEPTQGNPSSPQGKWNHPHAKPSDVMETLVLATTGVVADPFAGSGSTLVAAKRLGRRSIGVELEERHCEMAAKRLAQGALDFGTAS